jgi:hypothetical protein
MIKGNFVKMDRQLRTSCDAIVIFEENFFLIADLLEFFHQYHIYTSRIIKRTSGIGMVSGVAHRCGYGTVTLTL